MKPSSEKRLQQLHPALGVKVRAVITDLAAQGIVVEVVQGLRTFDEQDALYAQGRTKPGQIVTRARGGESNHNYGLAVDLCPFTDDRPDWNAPIVTWAAIGTAAAAHGLEWGGAWKKFLDKPHVELPSMTVKECQTCFASGGMESVWTEASRKIGWDGGEAAPAAAGARSPRSVQTRAPAAKKLARGAIKTRRRTAPARKRAGSSRKK